jgi:hypothetical protein
MEAATRERRTPRRSLIVTVSALVLAIGVLGIGVASAQATGDTYTGCLKGGTLTKVAIGNQPVSRCSPSATEVSWNESGQSGVLGFYTRTVNINKSLADDEQTNGTATCDTGDVATGGGFHSFTGSLSDAQASVLDNRPEGENAWYVQVGNLDAGQSVAVYADVYVRCADVTT